MDSIDSINIGRTLFVWMTNDTGSYRLAAFQLFTKVDDRLKRQL